MARANFQTHSKRNLIRNELVRNAPQTRKRNHVGRNPRFKQVYYMASYPQKKARSGQHIKELRKALNNSKFIPLRYDVVTSDEFLNLSLSAKVVFIHLLGKYNRLNNGDLSAPLNRAKEEFNLSKRSLQKAIEELNEHNFLEVTRAGGKNQCSLYALTCYPLNEVNKAGVFIKATERASDKWKRTT